MAKISQDTIRRVLDTADIVEVVGDYVSLRKRGANYSGLCPFHNERTPSFSVSPRLGMCKCFSCGETASAVGFVMKIEQMTFYEAIRHLAKKYGIEVIEEEISAEQRAASSQRESMFTLNQWAMARFENNLLNTPEGQSVGLGYFRKRGLTDAIIAKFHLGYSPENRTDLTDAALNEGFSLDYLVGTGLTIVPEDNNSNNPNYNNPNNSRRYDRYRARVIYPIFNVAGKVVGFGGRTLSSEKKVAKYVNSPESPIYDKSRELYGLYQAKSSIAKKDRCILVEGYMDVISMHQAGVENVVASSGTSLTEGQIVLIRRFTRNVTVIYDADAAGIKASLRGIDLLLKAGMAIKVMLLPEGEDPDSFAQSHSSEEVENYLNEHQEDFISFKIRILLEDVGDDPIARAKVINDIIASIAVIPDMIERQVYIKEAANKFGIEEKAVSLQVTVVREKNAEQEAKRKFIERENAKLPQDQHHPQGGYDRQGHPQVQGNSSNQGHNPYPTESPYPTEPPIPTEPHIPSETPGSNLQGQASPTSHEQTQPQNQSQSQSSVPVSSQTPGAQQSPTSEQVGQGQELMSSTGNGNANGQGGSLETQSSQGVGIQGYQRGTPYSPSSVGYPQPAQQTSSTYNPSYPTNAPQNQGSGSYPGYGSNGNDHGINPASTAAAQQVVQRIPPVILAAERDLMLYVLRYGMMRIADWVDEEGNTTPMTVLEYVRTELTQDDITFSDPSCRQAYQEALTLFNTTWFPDFTNAIDRAEQKRIAFIKEGQEVIRREVVDISDITKREHQLNIEAQNLFDTELNDYAAAYICRFLLSCPNEQVRVLTEQLIADKHELSKVHSKYSHLITEKDRLDEVVPKAVYVLKDAILGENIGQLRQKIAQESRNGADPQVIEDLMRQIMQLNNLKSQFAKELGERIIAPRRR